jgi:hypothetical protein
MNARHLTVRNLPEQLAAALDAERKKRGTSLNRTVIDLLSRSLALNRKRSNGLGRLGSTWSEKDLKEFERATRVFEEIDRELWR